MCGPALLSDAERELVAAYRATPGQASASPFGAEDEIGMLNLIDSNSMRRALAAVNTSRVFDLSVDYFVGMPVWTAAGDMPFQIWMNHTPRGTVVDDLPGAGREANELASYSGDSVAMYTHCGTHVDALCHWGYRGTIWNGFTEEERLGSRHWAVAGADRQPPIVARGVLIDVAAAHGATMLPASYGIGEDDLRQGLRAQGTELRCGDVVLVRTGRMSVWPDPEAYLLDAPGLNREGAEFLAKAGAILIGADNVALEQIPPSAGSESWSPVHTYLLAEAGVAILEIANLEELAAERVYEFAFVGACIRFRGATGAPIRPLAVPLQ
jgi:kynurenine formamidase